MRWGWLALSLLCGPGWLWAGVTADGTDDLASCGSASVIDTLTQRSILLWVNVHATAGNNSGRLIVKQVYGGNFDGWELYVDRPNLEWNFLQDTNGTGAASGIWSTANSVFTTGAWHHLALTYDGGSLTNVPVFYLNGTAVSVDTDQTPTKTISDDAAANLRLFSTAEPFFYLGATVKDVCYCTGLLSAARIVSVATGQMRGGCREACGSTLRFYAPFDDGPSGTSADGDAVRDESGQGNVCTLDDGANNTGLTWSADDTLSYP